MWKSWRTRQDCSVAYKFMKCLMFNVQLICTQVLKSCSPTASPSRSHLFRQRQPSSTKPRRHRETQMPGALYILTSCCAPRDYRTCSWCQTVTSTMRRAPYRPSLPTTSTAGSSPLVSGKKKKNPLLLSFFWGGGGEMNKPPRVPLYLGAHWNWGAILEVLFSTSCIFLPVNRIENPKSQINNACAQCEPETIIW